MACRTRLQPEKRPRTTLSPSFALRDGKAWMAFGTPGGEQQDQWSLILFLRMVHHDMTIQEAIDAPSFHYGTLAEQLLAADCAPGKGGHRRSLLATPFARSGSRGHDVSKGDDWSEGRLSGARQEPDGQMFAGANPRGMQGYAVGR